MNSQPSAKHLATNLYKTIAMSQEASAIPFAALTAWRALHGTARISEGYVDYIYTPFNRQISFCFCCFSLCLIRSITRTHFCVTLGTISNVIEINL